MAEIIIGKQRNGPIGTVKLAFIKRVHALREPRGARWRGNSDPADGRHVSISKPSAIELPRDRPIARRESACGSPRAVRPASSPSSRRTRTATARRRSALALEEAGAAMLACADIEEGIVAAPRGRARAGSSSSARSSVSDLDGVFEHHLTPTISTPGGRARALQAAAAKTAGVRCGATSRSTPA